MRNRTWRSSTGLWQKGRLRQCKASSRRPHRPCVPRRSRVFWIPGSIHSLSTCQRVRSICERRAEGPAQQQPWTLLCRVERTARGLHLGRPTHSGPLSLFSIPSRPQQLQLAAMARLAASLCLLLLAGASLAGERQGLSGRFLSCPGCRSGLFDRHRTITGRGSASDAAPRGDPALATVCQTAAPPACCCPTLHSPHFLGVFHLTTFIDSTS